MTEYKELPSRVNQILTNAEASPRLVAHLRLVYSVAIELTKGVSEKWPQINTDADLVHLGAATHDIGKVVYTNELHQGGKQHERAGQQFLLQRKFTSDEARFAYTHGNWQQFDDPTLEDLLVALADNCWKGKRNRALEDKLLEEINRQTKVEKWEDFLKLDELIAKLAADADARLAWQKQFPI